MLKTHFDPAQQQVTISWQAPTGEPHELRIETDGLTAPEGTAEINLANPLYYPPRETPAVGEQQAEEILLLFNDTRLTDGWDLVLRFPSAGGTWALNGPFGGPTGEIRPEVAIPTTTLEWGENLLFLRAATIERPRMHYRRRVEGGGEVSVNVGRSDWRGIVSLVRSSEGGEVVVERAEVAGPAYAAPAMPTSGDSRTDESPRFDAEQLRRAAIAVGENLLRGQVRRPGSPFEGGFYLVYDALRRSYRVPHWLWAWGPAIHLLLQLEELARPTDPTLAARFREAAVAAGRRSLAFEVTQPGHPAQGVSTVRWEAALDTPAGFARYVSTADSLFLAGWGWMSLHDATGNDVFLRRTESLVRAAERLMGQYPVVPQDYIAERDRWTAHTLDESVFGMIGFRRLVEAAGSEPVRDAGRRFIDSHLEHMSREQACLWRIWMRDEDRGWGDLEIKGHAWVFEGYLDAWLLTRDPKYLALVRMLADRVIACQHPEGHWTMDFRVPRPDDRIDDRAAAIWAYLLYAAHRETRVRSYLSAARKALAWCLRHQHLGDDPALRGAIPNLSQMTYVTRRPITILYTTTFCGLAALEELSMAGGNGAGPA